MQMIKVGSDFSGVGAFNQALTRLGIEFDEIFACDMDKFARQTFIHNYGEPKYYPENVYDRQIPSESLDIYMTSPPCQAFSLAGKRLGKDDERGILFFNSHEFIKKNKPRYFIFENVKGLLSDDNGKTFGEWIRMLGGKCVNGLPVLFPDNDSVPYHIFYKVLNAKKHGVPQNRERVFIVGIRDDNDLTFRWPIEEHLTKKLKDVLESDVDEKYFLGENQIKQLVQSNEKPFLQIKSATSKGYETATENDSINLSVPNSETRRGRVGKGVAQTLDTSCNQGIWVADFRTDEGLRIRKDNISPCMTASMKEPNEKMSRGNCVPFVGNDYKIRRLTPRECFRLMDFPDSFTWPVSDSQAYKQAGNSIVVGVLEKIIERLNL